MRIRAHQVKEGTSGGGEREADELRKRERERRR